MNWGRVKTVFIYLFLCADIFLLGIYFTSVYSSSVISEDIIGATISALQVNEIYIDESVIPRKMPKASHIEVENVISDQEAFARSILGEDISATNTGFESPQGTLTFYGDRFNFQATPLLTSWYGTENIAKNLETLGFDLSSADVVTEKNDNGISLIFNNFADSLPVFNSQVIVTTSENHITSISGVWFNETRIISGDNLKDITAALIDFIPQAPKGITITKLEPGYDIFDKTAYHKTTMLIPVWKVTCSDGNTYFLDARNID